ncbi:MAG: MFS transporter, partial [Clostridiales bacterium]|nr:MFS transporter [Clostridiales bacterium]
DFVVGIVNTANVWTTVTALASCFIYAKLKNVKRFLLIANFCARFPVCVIALLPLLFGGAAGGSGVGTGAGSGLILASALMVIFGNAIWSIYAVGANVWLMSSIPKTIRTPYIYARTMWLRVSFTLSSIVMGIVLDSFADKGAGFVLIFMLSLFFSILDLFTLARIPYQRSEGKGVRAMIPSVLLAPFRDKVYARFLLFIFIFNVMLYASISFTPLYFLKYMSFSYKYTSFVSAVSYACMIVSTLFWRELERRRGIMFVFRASAIVYLLEALNYVVLTPGNLVSPFLAAFFAGFGGGGMNIIIFNYRYEVMPEDNSTNYETWFMVAQGLAIMLGPVIGNLIREALSTVYVGGFAVSNFQQMYLLSFCVSGLSIPLCLGLRGRAAEREE